MPLKDGQKGKEQAARQRLQKEARNHQHKRAGKARKGDAGQGKPRGRDAERAQGVSGERGAKADSLPMPAPDDSDPESDEESDEEEDVDWRQVLPPRARAWLQHRAIVARRAVMRKHLRDANMRRLARGEDPVGLPLPYAFPVDRFDRRQVQRRRYLDFTPVYRDEEEKDDGRALGHIADPEPGSNPFAGSDGARLWFKLRIRRWMVSMKNKKFRLARLYVRQDVNWLSLFAVVAVVVAIALTGVHKVRPVLYLELYWLLAISLALFAYGVYFASNYGVVRHLTFYGFKSLFEYGTYGNTSAWNVFVGRANYFYGSGYNTTEVVLLRHDIYSYMMDLHHASSTSRELRNSCKNSAEIEYEGEVALAKALGGRLGRQRGERLKRQIELCALYVQQTKELQDSRADHRTSYLTKSRLKDQDFGQRGGTEGYWSTLFRTMRGLPPPSN